MRQFFSSLTGRIRVPKLPRLPALDRLASVLAAVVLFGATAAGSGWIFKNFERAREQDAHTQMTVLRDSIAMFRDLWHFEKALSEISAPGEISPQAFFDFEQRTDFLYLRAQQLEDRARPDEAASSRVDDVVSRTNQIVALADLALGAGAEERGPILEAISPQVQNVSRAAMGLFDAQHAAQTEAHHQHDEVIETLAFSAIGILCMFGGIAALATFLLQRQLRIQAKRKEAEEKANFLAFFDGLTGLPNRESFRRQAEKLLAASGDPAVFLFDLDDFKLVNDLHGHSAGDAVLLRSAKAIERWTKDNGGVAARLGGDEFAAILPGPLSSMKIASICEQLLEDVSASFDFDGTLLTAKLSIGVAATWSLETEQELTLTALQKAADIALYRAKEQGKNSYAFFDGDLAEMAARRQEIEIGISQALENGDFTLALQPQVEMDGGRVRGFEALARWTKDDKPISPGEFVPIAEATGQVVEIDLWGMREAAGLAAEWIAQGRLPVPISVNLSSLHFRSDDIVGHVADVLADTGLAAHLLTLEITESILIEDLSKVTIILEKLRALGVSLALDDFGTGYSSLAYLRRLDVDYIKIDQSFVRDLEESSETQLILDALVDIAKGLGKTLVVEGIESETQAEIVRRLGCELGQGYLWGRPMPKEEALELVPQAEEALKALLEAS